MTNDDVLRQILERNRRVEADKAWERSFTRRACIAGITYACACLLLRSLSSPLFWLQALLPTAGYVLSTLSLPWVKRWWLARQ